MGFNQIESNLGMIPRLIGSEVPCMVNDLPQPVWPYANTVPLYPSVTLLGT